jgi:hypothetical protein
MRRRCFVGDAGEYAVEKLPRLGERALGVGIARARHHLVDADQVAVADAQRVFLEAQEDVAVEELAGQAVLEPVPPRASRALRMRVVEAVEEGGTQPSSCSTEPTRSRGYRSKMPDKIMCVSKTFMYRSQVAISAGRALRLFS